MPSSRLRRVGRVEFTSLLALSMALAALGIDLMLPALGAMRADLGLAPDSTAMAGVVTAYLVGLALGQVLYGPVADRFGRRPALYAGYAIYGLGAAASAVSPGLGVLLAARFVWGLGAAGPRVVTLAAIRDVYAGERMSRAMSFVMAVFILVPVVAPSLGAAINAVASWRWVLGVCVLAVAVMALWAVRLPETLAPEHRLELRPGRIARAGRFVVSNRRTALLTLALTALYAVFLSYLASSEIILARTFGRADLFPVVFGGLAAAMGLAMLLNARVVGRLGLHRLTRRVLRFYVVAATLLAAMAVATGGRPPLWLFVAGLVPMLCGHALLIPNLNALAMEPMAPVAGTASSVIGATQMAVGAALASALDRAYDGTVVPLSLGFLGYGLVALALVAAAERAPGSDPDTDRDAGSPIR